MFFIANSRDSSLMNMRKGQKEAGNPVDPIRVGEGDTATFSEGRLDLVDEKHCGEKER